QSAAVDQHLRANFAAAATVGLRRDDRLSAVGFHAQHARARLNFAAAFLDQLRVLPRDAGIVDDAGDGHPEAFDAADVRLDLAHALRADFFDAFDAVGLGSREELAQFRELKLLRRDHDLAADVVGDLVFAAELDQPLAAFDARPGFARP